MTFSYKMVFLLACVIFIASCKSDTTVSSGPSTTSVQPESTNIETKKPKKKEFYTASERAQDSLMMIAKMENKGMEIDQKIIQENLDQIRASKEAKRFDLPRACDVLTPEEVAQILNLDPSTVNEVKGRTSGASNVKNSTCFWKWEEKGMLVQFTDNPVREDVPDWVSRFINTKKTSGEVDFQNQSKKYLYTDFDGPGTLNAKNTEAGRYYMSREEDFLVSIVFTGSQKNQDAKAKQLANLIFSRI